ncbi:hypothetical protein [Myxococcus qinghaiensis]|uniref:hypothetical protein n=1 Tax=Myxococcus qinghaiensis TaxID=2906758 RepID=UPI00389969BB
MRPKHPEESRRKREQPPLSRVPSEHLKHLEESRRKQEHLPLSRVPLVRLVPRSQGATLPS